MKRITNRKIFFITTYFVFFLSMCCFAQTVQNPFEIGRSGKTPTVNPITIQNNTDTTNLSSTTVEEKVVQEEAKEEKTENPFEKQESPAIADTSESVPLRTYLDDSKNPFDVAAVVAPKEKTTRKKPREKDKRLTQKNKGSTKEEANASADSSSSGFLFTLIILMTILFAVLITLFRPFFAKVYQAFVSDNQLRSAYREMGSSLSPPYYFLYAMFLVNASIFIYLIMRYYGVDTEFSWLQMLYLFGGLSAIFMGKHLLVLLVGAVFPVAKEASLYNFTIIIFNTMLGVVLVPLNLLLAYAPTNLVYAILCLSVILIGLTYLYRSIRSILISSKFLAFHKFHFFMYLCTAEIAPLVLVVKFILDQIQ